MAFLFGEPVEQYGGTVSNATTVYASPPQGSIQATGGRFGGACFRANSVSNGVIWTLPGARATTTQGVSAKQTAFNGAVAAPTTVLFQWYDGATIQCSIHVLSDGSVAAYRGQTTALLGASAAGVYTVSVYQRVEAQATIHNTTGAITVQINGVAVLTLTNVNTRVSANNQATQIGLLARTNSGGISSIDWCDWTVTDSTGTDNTGFLGDKRSYTSVPAGAGTYQTSDAPVGAVTRALAAASNDGDTSYNPYSAASTANTFTPTALPAGVTGIVAVQQWAVLRKDDAGTNTARLLMRSASTDSESADIAVNTTFTYYNRMVERDPNVAGTAGWTVSGADAAEFGVKRQA